MSETGPFPEPDPFDWRDLRNNRSELPSVPPVEAQPVYRVEVDHGGCEHCAQGRTWTVVGPDDTAIGQSFEAEEDADDVADLMTEAYGAGRLAAIHSSPALPLQTYESQWKSHYRDSEMVECGTSGEWVKADEAREALAAATAREGEAYWRGFQQATYNKPGALTTADELIAAQKKIAHCAEREQALRQLVAEWRDAERPNRATVIWASDCADQLAALLPQEPQPKE